LCTGNQWLSEPVPGDGHAREMGNSHNVYGTSSGKISDLEWRLIGLYDDA
jgi:hypothetical protein